EDGQRVATEGQGDGRGGTVPADQGHDRGAEPRLEAPGFVLPQQHVVEVGQDGGRRGVGEGGRPDRVADQGGGGGRLDTPAADVADDEDEPAAVEPDGVVEVAADLDAGPAGGVAGRQLHAGDRRERRREQARLQRPGQADL